MPRVLIAGAGARGLVCGRALAAAGCQVELIEASQRAGGSLLAAEALSVEPATATSLGLRSTPPLALEAWRAVPASAPVAPAAMPSRWRRFAARWRSSRAEAGSASPPADPGPDPTRVLLSGPELARDLGGSLSVRFGWEVLEVGPYGRGASLLYQAPSGEKRLEADAAVVAVPAAAVSGVVPALGAEGRRALDATPRRTRLWVIWEGLASPPSDRAWRVEDPAHPELSELWHTQDRVAVRFTHEASVRHAAAPDDELTALAEAGLRARGVRVEGGTARVVRAAWDAAPAPVEPPSPEVALALATADDAQGVLAGALRAAGQILDAVGG